MISELSVAERATIHAALADPRRLAIVEELAMSDRSPSELCVSLEMGSNLLAHHLAVLEEARLIERLPSAGDGRRRYIRLVPDALSSIGEPVATLAARRVLFVCTANSARSQLAAAVWNVRHEVPATSSGTRPAPRVHPEAVKAAARVGLDLSGARTRSMSEDAEASDLIVTVCDVAHEELRALLGGARVLHWSIPDPVKEGTPSAFDRAVRHISSQVRVLAPRVHPYRRPRRSRP
jgi:protein-tyrosine-phosphatase